MFSNILYLIVGIICDQIPDKTHIRNILLCEFRKGTSAAGAARYICVIYPGAISESCCCKWFKKFKSGTIGLEDQPRSGRPSKINNEDLKHTIESDPRQTSYNLREDQTTILRHLHEIGKVSRAAVLVPHELTEQNIAKQNDLILQELLRIS